MKTSLLILALSATAAAAQPLPADGTRIVIWAGPVFSTPSSGGTLTTDYAPVLELATDYTSRATQTLKVDLGTGTGVEVGADIFFGGAFGVQAAFVHSGATISGEGNGDYLTYLRYTARQPPDYIPREYTSDNAQPWPDTAGSVSTNAVLFGGVARLNSAQGRLEATLGGGVSLTWVDARVESVGYTAYRLGGHSVLFGSQQRVVVSTSGTGAVVRPYLGGQIGVRLNGRFSLVAGLRTEMGSDAAVVASPERVMEPDAGFIAAELADIQRVLALKPMQLPIPRWHVVAALRVRAW